MIMIRESDVCYFVLAHPPVMDAGERAQVRHEHAVVLLLGAGEVREAAEPLHGEAKQRP
jgi:hypothetical protein